MSVKLIKNGIVNMDWDAEGFYESHESGFIAAVHIYDTPNGDLAVCFKDNRAFIILDLENEETVSREGLYKIIRAEAVDGDDISECYPDEYVQLGDIVSVDEEVADVYGLSEADQQDILERLNDLSTYWEVEEVEM